MPSLLVTTLSASVGNALQTGSYIDNDGMTVTACPPLQCMHNVGPHAQADISNNPIHCNCAK